VPGERDDLRQAEGVLDRGAIGAVRADDQARVPPRRRFVGRPVAAGFDGAHVGGFGLWHVAQNEPRLRECRQVPVVLGLLCVGRFVLQAPIADPARDLARLVAPAHEQRHRGGIDAGPDAGRQPVRLGVIVVGAGQVGLALRGGSAFGPQRFVASREETDGLFVGMAFRPQRLEEGNRRAARARARQRQRQQLPETRVAREGHQPVGDRVVGHDGCAGPNQPFTLLPPFLDG
jgi:hypothetical protein